MEERKKDRLRMAATALVFVAGMGAMVFVHDLSKAEEWHGRCKALLEENRYLREELNAMEQALAARNGNFTVTVHSREYAPRTLAQKNRNYLNVKAATDHTWKGQIGRDRFGHAIFEDASWSIRAGALTLKAYEERYGIRTVEGLVRRFSESNQREYIAHLCQALGVKPEQEFSFKARMPELLKAMVKFECGQVLGEEHLALVAAIS